MLSKILYLRRNGVRLADLVAPETPSDWHDGQLGEDDGAPDGGGHLFAALDTETNVSVVVANGCKK